VISCATGFNCQLADADQCLNVWLKGFCSKKRKLLTVGLAADLWWIWKTRNLACFENKWPNKQIEVLFRICYRIEWWANLQVMEDTKTGAAKICTKLREWVAGEVFRASRGWAAWQIGNQGWRDDRLLKRGEIMLLFCVDGCHS
jgi:hypothetical protein